MLGNGLDDDGDGFPDDVHGWDFSTCSQSALSNAVCGSPNVFAGGPGSTIDSHGTHVAGIIGARGDNGIGVTGIDWQVSILPVKVLGPDGGSVSNIIRGYNYVRTLREHGVNVRVTNNSYGGNVRSQAAYDAISSLNDAGILVVAAAGNESRDNFAFPRYPSDYELPNVISVASSDGNDALSVFSNFGSRTVTMAAPGSMILSTVPNADYLFFNGTSMAAPFVAGAAALVLSVRPDLRVENLRGVLAFSGDMLPSLQDKTTTGRRLNVAAALTAAQKSDSTAPSPASNLQLTVQSGRSVTLQWVAPGDDGAMGTAADYDFFFTRADGTRLPLPTTLAPSVAGTQESATLTVPYQNFSGTVELRAYDNAGNFSTASVPVQLPQGADTDPYNVTETAAESLTTGGTPLGVVGDDVFKEFVTLPFAFNFFGVDRTSVAVSSNGALYFSPIPRKDIYSTNGEDAGGSAEGLRGQAMIAGLWDDLRTDRGGNVYMVQPDPSRVVFRWEAVTFDTPLPDGTTRGEHPVNFEIELRNDGVIVTRYGANQSALANTNLFPVVGISAGEPDPYVVTSHTSESALKSLTNAPTVTLTPRASASPRATISGQVKGSCCTGFIDLSNIAVTLSGSRNATTTTDYSGFYQFKKLPIGGSYTVMPSKSNLTFTPPSATFNNLNQNQTGDFSAEHLRYAISGQVTDVSSKGLPNVTVGYGGSNSGTTQTDANGFYSITGFEGQTYTISASSLVYMFTPQSITFHDLAGNQTVNFTANPLYNIRGRVTNASGKGISGISLNASGQMFRSATTDANGDYVLNQLTGGANYTVTLQSSDYFFSPPSQTYTPLASDQTADFTAFHAYTIEGRVLDSDGNALGGVMISLNGPQSATAASNPPGGYYQFYGLPEGGTYTVTPVVPGFTATPASRTFSNLSASSFTASFVLTAANPIDTSQFFIHQHYIDFLNREPDASGLNFWMQNINNCNGAGCSEAKRVDTSAAFYLSIEFQQTGYLIERIYKSAYGDGNGTAIVNGAHFQLPVPIVRFAEFLPDTQKIGQGVVVGQAGWEQQLENNKQAFTTEFVQRSRFTIGLPTSMTPAEFVDKLFTNAGVMPSASERAGAISEFGSATTSVDPAGRARALRRVAENSTLIQQEFNRAFVLMQYFGYLRRNPNEAPDADYTGFNFWLSKLNQFNGNFVNAEMVKAFITSTEYRSRFGP